MQEKPQVKIQKLPDSQVEIEVEVSPSALAEFKEEALKHLASHTSLKGFRQGKAPAALVEQEIGSEKIEEEIINLALEKTYSDIIIENKLSAIGHPEITIIKFALGNPFIYKAKFSVWPEFVLPDYKKIATETNAKEKKEVVVEEKEIEETLNWLKKSRTKYSSVERPAKKGDFVEIDFETRLAGVKVENGGSKNHPFVIGEGGFMPGFEDNLSGLEIGKEKEFSLTAPEDYFAKNLAGKILDFKVKLNTLKQAELPEIDDNFAKTVGKFENMEALKNSIREGILTEKEQKEKERVRLNVIEAISGQTFFEIPKVLIEHELDKMIVEFEASVRNMGGLSFDDYLEQIKKTKEDLRKELTGDAEKRARIALILREIAEKEKIQVSDEEITEHMTKTLSRYPEEEVKKIDLERLKDYTLGVIKNEKVFKLLE